MLNDESLKAAQQRMEQFTHEFPADLRESIKIAKANPIELDVDRIQNIVICGMGGSGIGGMIARDILRERLKVPIEFCKAYDIPNYVNDRSLVICSSYSGNTEETLSLFDQAKERQAQIISICSGGELAKKTIEVGAQVLSIPGGKQPRAAVGLSIIQQIHILGNLFLTKEEIEDLFQEIKTLATKLEDKTEAYQKNANAIARDLHLKHINVFTDTTHASIATRFTQQINENVKKKAHAGIIPEMNHNELVAFKDYTKMDTVLFINPNRFSKQNVKRFNFLKQELKKQGSNIIEMNFEGKSNVDLFEIIYQLDLISIEKAKINNVNPEEVKVIDRLKYIISE